MNFRHLAVKDRHEQKIVRQLSSCLIEKFNGFTIVSIEYQKNEKKYSNQLMLFISQQKKLKWNQLVIFQKTFQKHILLYIQKEKEV